jgi:CDP-paratose 2-epimerase
MKEPLDREAFNRSTGLNHSGNGSGHAANNGSSNHTTPRSGITEWFRPGEFERVGNVLETLRTLRVQNLRIVISWADWHESEGNGWYSWLLENLAREVNVLPCVVYTPPCLGIAPKFSSPPATSRSYADFIDVMIARLGKHFEWLQLWDSPGETHGGLSSWDTRLDPDWRIFTEMIGGAAYRARNLGKKVVLPGLWPAGTRWLELLHQRGVLSCADAIGLHAIPGSPEANWAEVKWKGWAHEIAELQETLARLGVSPELWITETGFSTWREAERAQMRAFLDAMEAPAQRVYWKELRDRSPEPVDLPHSDERQYHYGLKRANGIPKLLFSSWAGGGLTAIRRTLDERPRHRGPGNSPKHVLITGGAGFIGTNLADRLLSAGRPVMIYDDLSRSGVQRNLAWLREQHGELLRVETADVRDRHSLRRAVRHADSVFHLAAQVAVTTSLHDPLHDFGVNVGGTLNLLEELRALDAPPPLLFTSTNKVYGALTDLALEKNCTRYQPLEKSLPAGIGEDRPLAFHSPYGCSKGAADQYVLDYARTFALPAVVFRMSCIYGFHQMGTEDQGWVAHFLIRALSGRPLVLYGDGMQVRDLLFIEDLLDAFILALANIHTLSGEAFNIGGGLGNTLSLLELLDLIGTMHGSLPAVQMESWRCADQRYFVSDTRKFKNATGWSPRVNARQGVERLYHWLREFHGSASPVPVPSDGGVYAILPH